MGRVSGQPRDRAAAAGAGTGVDAPVLGAPTEPGAGRVAGGEASPVAAVGARCPGRRKSDGGVAAVLCSGLTSAALAPGGSRPRALPGEGGRRDGTGRERGAELRLPQGLAAAPHRGGGQWEGGRRSGKAHVAASAANGRRRRP